MNGSVLTFHSDIGRTLTGGGYTNNTGMTDESCIAYCEKAGYIYAGTEYAEECYCGNTLASGSGPAPTADCNVACSGNATEPVSDGIAQFSLHVTYFPSVLTLSSCSVVVAIA